MSVTASLPPPSSAPGWRRLLPWAALVGLMTVALALLLWLTFTYESRQEQANADEGVAELAGDIKHALERDERSLHALQWTAGAHAQWVEEATALLRRQPAMLRIERRDLHGITRFAVDSPFVPALVDSQHRTGDPDTALACAGAMRKQGSVYSRSFFVPLAGGTGAELVDVCQPLQEGGRVDGFLVATYSLPRLLEHVADDLTRSYEVSFVEGDGTRLARAGKVQGGGTFRAERIVDLPGSALLLRLESARGPPRLIPNLPTALAMGLSVALGAVMLLLVRDARRRFSAEAALGEALAFRKAMEDSLVTGLYARDLEHRITYVNPAFCAMLGFRADELVGRADPPYWPPERAAQYREWQHQRASQRGPWREEGLEVLFMRRDGHRISVLISEAPLVDRTGRHTGWMSAAMDVSGKHKMEEVARQQQERLQATARLATVGEMASMLSHELNQPLAAIASYATGSLNLLQESPRMGPPEELEGMLRQALQRVSEQAERAGRVIKSVHDFVRRREQASEAVGADLLVNAVLPLVRLQARKSGTRVDVEMPRPMPHVMCDRTMVEQVLLNLTRNGIQAMETFTAPAQRVLRIEVAPLPSRRVEFRICDRGAGIAPQVAERLFTPFFTTREQGMGLGLSLCRTVVEQHGGSLRFENHPPGPQGEPGGVTFSFSLAPAPIGGRPRPVPAPRHDATLPS